MTPLSSNRRRASGPRLAALSCIALLTLGALGAQRAAARSPAYHVVRRIPLGGAGGWNYVSVDTAGHRLFIARTDRVMVVDESSGRLLGEVRGLERGHGVAFAPPAGHGFATSGADSSVTMFDLRTLAPLKKIPAAVDADAVLYDQASRRVFTFNGDAHSATVIDPVAGARIGSVALGGKPEFGVSDGAGHLFVNIADKGEIAELDPRAMTVTRRWSIAPCEDPSGLAIDVARHRLFSVCGNGVLAVSDAVAGGVVATVPIGRGVDAAAYDPATRTVFASNGDGTLSVIRQETADRYRAAQAVPTMRGARTMGLDPRTHRVYTVSARFGPAPATPTAGNPRRRPPIVAGSFTLLELAP